MVHAPAEVIVTACRPTFRSRRSTTVTALCTPIFGLDISNPALLKSLIDSLEPATTPTSAVFTSGGQPLTRFGLYKIVRRLGRDLDDPRTSRRVTPHVFRHTAAVHLLEAGVEVNVIRGWLGQADLSTTNRYAEINTRTKQAALRAAEPPKSSAASRGIPIWRSDESLLKWLATL